MSKKLFRTLLFVITAAMFAVLAYYCYFVEKTSNGEITIASYAYICGLTVMSCLSAYYAFAGCNKKDGSGFFKLYMLVFSVFEFSTFIGHQYETVIQVMNTAIRMSVLVLLARALDLGKKRSFNCTYILFITSIIDIISLAIGGKLSYALLSLLIEILPELVCFLMVRAKYADKAERLDKQLE